jgi:NAD(P)-dependent dehydrogenase (short-subunit alcohol dehydrogenase family)
MLLNEPQNREKKMNLNLTGRTAVITGGSMGIGKAIARGLAAEGVNLVLIARNQENLDQVAEEIRRESGVEVLARSTDVTNTDSVNATAAAAAEKFGAIHILVNNAGHRMRRLDRQILWDDQDWRADIEAKTISMLRVIRAFIPHLATDGAGRIINMGGMGGKLVWETALTHGLNNAAVSHITGYLARDLAGDHITVNTIIPGLVSTEWRHGWASTMAEKQGKSKDEFLADYCSKFGILAGRWGSPEEVADLVVFVASDRGKYINGAQLVIDGGMNVNPR